MKSIHVTATHTQIIESLFPGYQIEVRYKINATVSANEAKIVFEPTLQISTNGEAWESVITPTESTADGRRFLAFMREAARNEAYKARERYEMGEKTFAEIKAQQSQPETETREYRHTMAEMFPKFRPISPFSDEWFAG